MSISTPNDVSVDAGSGARRLCDEPASFFGDSHTAMHTIDRDELAGLQLDGLRYRFDDLRSKIPMLERLAGRQEIDQLANLDDVVPVLFEHTMYKSYPAALLEQGRFTDLTRWLDKLTAVDLAGLDVSGCELIDDWVGVLDERTELKIVHSSGTSGTMSLLPMSKAEWQRFGRLFRVIYLQRFGEDVDPMADAEIFAIYPYFRYGASAHIRVLDMIAEHLLGSEDRLYVAYPGRLSSDVLFLAGRLRAAQARGDADRLRIPPALAARRDQFEQLQKEMPQQLEAFLERTAAELQGKRIFMAGTWNLFHGMATRGLAKGLEKMFEPNSIVSSGGGAKGMVPPPNWQEDVCRFFGIESITMAYGMSEINAVHLMCERGRYHFVPWVIPFLLDPETGQALPRRGTVTGRAAFFDLTAETRWGGFVTGDRITVDWDHACECGRKSAYIVGEIERFSDLKGGDDKITCAATESAHRDAMEFLTGVE